MPIQKDIEALNTYLEGVDKDSLIELVVSSLPEETQKNGSDTVLQLNHKVSCLRGWIHLFYAVIKYHWNLTFQMYIFRSMNLTKKFNENISYYSF